MSIASGSDGLASDFITKSERNGTKSNDSGRVAQLESDGYLDPEFLKDVSARVRASTDQGSGVIPWDTEDFDTASIHGSTGETAIFNDNTTDADETSAATTDWFAQQFATGAGDYLITKASFYLQHTLDSSNTVEFVLRSSLTGADLASSDSGQFTFNPSGTGVTQVDVNFRYKCSPSTTYYLVIKVITYPGSGQLTARRNSAGSGGWRTDDSGASWTAVTGGYKAQVYTNSRMYFKAPEAGKYLIIFNYDGDTSDKTIRMYVNNTVVAKQTIETADPAGGTVAGGGNLMTLYSLSANDIVFVSTDSALEADGSTFEIIRLR